MPAILHDKEEGTGLGIMVSKKGLPKTIMAA
jgi:hypothetical protein